MSLLDDLLASTKARVAELSGVVSEEALEQRITAAAAPRGFAAALAGDDIALIAEVKRASPSKGVLKEDLNPRELAGAFRDGGAAAISVLTEPDYFLGSMEDLGAAREAGLPVLRKDFIIDPFQVFESRAWGADALLLIVRAVGNELATLYMSARSLGLDVLVEVFDEADLDRALDLGPDLIGINHRDLTTFEVDPERTAKLAPLVPDGCTIVALSGVEERAEVAALHAAGAQAVLVGESLVRASDPATKVRELMGR
ncbi:MAG TPA: indole-3-glycerol phosphate synthase TrpC [Actinomycetota bacterium]|nr:indole-3-glycerol phosphate synthase TrpC [Actinomycetota bacterium]